MASPPYPAHLGTTFKERKMAPTKSMIRFIMESEGVNREEAIEIWEDELECCEGDVEEALFNLGMELDYAL
jgi:NACalpha-BTF3-like transcription factor